MEDKKRQRRTAGKSNQKKKKKMSYRKKVQMIQLGAISIAILLLVLVGAFVLTKVFVGKADNTGQTSTAAVGEKETATEETVGTDEAAQADGEQSQDVSVETETGTEGGDSEPENTPEEPQSVLPVEEVKLTVSMVGDCTIGTDESFDIRSNFDAFYIVKKDPAYFFKGVSDIPAADDLTVINMEGTLTESTERQDKTYAFKGDPKYTAILNAGSVEAANLANNHSHDYGEQSYTDTIQYLEEAGINTFGYDRTSVLDIKGVKVGLVGIYVLADGMER